jgi:hypothetical protein
MLLCEAAPSLDQRPVAGVIAVTGQLAVAVELPKIEGLLLLPLPLVGPA